MKNKDKILEIVIAKGRTTTGEVASILGVSRQYVSMIISELVHGGLISKLGSTRASVYVSRQYAHENPEIFPTVIAKTYRNVALEEHKVLTDIEERFPRISQLPENIKSIFTFAFSEMLNNAIEHSQSKVIKIEISIRNDKLSVVVSDSGVGAFRNIQKKRSLDSEIEAIQDLLKGKTTTMPKSHSGEGIFFTSKSAEIFTLDSFGYQLIVTRRGPEIKTVSAMKRGTAVYFEIDVRTEMHLTDIFKKYTNLTDTSDFGFDMTEIRVKLFTMSGVHISRSQARRILAGLEKFKIIVLDFSDVPIVGQAFADEIYRVFQRAHTDIEIREEHMSDGVQFMIERAKNEANTRKE